MEEEPRILFLCTSNYYRSRFAEAVFNYYAALAGLPWQACSRGLSPHLVRGELSPQVEDALLMRGISLRFLSPHKRPLTLEDLERSGRTIALQEDEHRPLMRLHFPEWVDRIEYWSVGGPARWGMASSLGAIESKIQDLIAALAREQVSRRVQRPR